ncbi:MAG: hypothetical protein IBGAMO2_890004 [Arenicellales bacterium IbO2]|nr:hypothetical protein [Gammaproteobacteria bacterium]MDA8007945.1 hypothetical protein [Gammaproteobacteria bacterium]CAJ2377624.1 MAG: hypothetical protein IBGAMO2_890004 [Arenicellales bacterium IbO2]
MSIGIIYETLCHPTGMRYRGKHKCRSAITLDRHYIGTGKALKADIQQYGKDAFVRTVILMCEPGWLDYYEAVLVDEEWVAREDTYNVDVGGKGASRPQFRRHPNRNHNHANWLKYLKRKAPVKASEKLSQEAMMRSLSGKWLVAANTILGEVFYISPDDETRIWFEATGFVAKADAVVAADRLNKQSFGREWHDADWVAIESALFLDDSL